VLLLVAKDSSYHLQAHMSVLLAEVAIQSHDYDHAIQLLTSVADPGNFSQLPELLTISLVRSILRLSVTDTEYLAKITGWNFNSLRFKICQQKCEALFAAGLTEGAVASFLGMDPSMEAKSKEEMEWVIGGGVCAYFASVSLTLRQISGGDVWIN